MTVNPLAPEKSACTVEIALLAERIQSRQALVAIVGMGYVGQPLAIAAHSRGFRVVGFDIDPERVAELNEGHSSIRTIPDAKIIDMRAGSACPPH
jgi:UDP-N-acetyl-D-glucosamine dehydrogenase